MTESARHRSWTLNPGFRPATAALAMATAFALTMAWTEAAAQTYTVLHNFTGHGDGATPYASLTMDRAGNSYGATLSGGNLKNCEGGCGVVFKLARAGSGWILSTLYTFQGGADGEVPYSGWQRLRIVPFSIGMDGKDPV